MDDDLVDLVEQIERCRRLARDLTDDDLRQSLEQLAHDYEVRLKRERKRGNFMLRDP